VAAALDICRARQNYEGEAAMRLEALVEDAEWRKDDTLAYPFTLPRLKESNLPYLEPLAMWNALLGDLVRDTSAPVIAARFHKGLAAGRAVPIAARDSRWPRCINPAAAAAAAWCGWRARSSTSSMELADTA
jgi:hydrogenase maturation protein HypF